MNTKAAKQPVTNEDASKYCAGMEEIKRRVDVISGLLGRTYTTGYTATDIESVYLQFRKVLELIALSSMLLNKEEYSKQHSKFASHWHANRILSDLEKINPDFYPIPSRQVIEQQTGKVLKVEPITEGHLTKDDFANLYEMCGGILHASNPFKPPQDLARYQGEADLWLRKIMTLLGHHQAQLLDKDYQLWVIMQTQGTNQVSAFTMQKVTQEEAKRRSQGDPA